MRTVSAVGDLEGDAESARGGREGMRKGEGGVCSARRSPFPSWRQDRVPSGGLSGGTPARGAGEAGISILHSPRPRFRHPPEGGPFSWSPKPSARLGSCSRSIPKSPSFAAWRLWFPGWGSSPGTFRSTLFLRIRPFLAGDDLLRGYGSALRSHFCRCWDRKPGVPRTPGEPQTLAHSPAFQAGPV